VWCRAAVALLFLASTARAYDQKVHVLLSTRAYRGPKSVAPDVAGAVDALRERIWKAGFDARDAALQKRFRARFAKPFDAWSFKLFLGLNPDKKVAGIDESALRTGPDGAAIYALASRLPDDDWRNRDRFLHDEARQVVKGPYGQPLPDDPATLEMGGLTGLSSQAHAHYQLPKLQFSDDPDVLKKEPRRFAIPPTVHTFGADYAELYTQLGALAGDERLALTLAGAAAHHVEDVANQIHAVQVGIYDFFVDAKLQSIAEELKSVGGILRSRPSFVSIGIDIIANHHTLAEALYQKHLLQPGDPVAAQTNAAPEDPAFAADLAALASGCTAGFARAIVYALADRSSVEGPQVYAEIRSAAEKKYSQVGVHFDESSDPDASLRANADLTKFWELEARGARRSDQALAAWWPRFDACRAAGPDVKDTLAEALVRDRLDALDARDARVRDYKPKPPEKEAVNPWVGIGYTVVLAIGIALVVRRRRRRKR